MWADYTYLTFKFLVMQDTITAGDGISTYVKYEKGGTGIADSEAVVLERTYTGAEENTWDEVFIEIPAEVKTSDYNDFCIITSEVNETGVALEMYYDHFRFTMYDDPSEIEAGIERLESQNGFSVYMLENMMNIRMDEPSYVNDVQVFDIKGSMVSQKALNSIEQNFSMPVDLQSGVYMLRVRTENETLTRKFVKL
ncbi:T9SS type A sorting domain-containing protein, partial [Bacteroidota bacterium]